MTTGKDLKELLNNQEGRILFAKSLSAFFFTLRVRNDEWPKLGYAENIRSNIKQMILSDFNIDISNLENFPDSEKNWRKYTIKLTEEGKAFTKHKDEIPPKTLDKIYMILVAVQAALENRNSDKYVVDYLSKIPAELHNKLHRIMMNGATFLVIFYEVRRGLEGLENMKQVDFRLVEDETFEFKYYKKFRSEQDKTHQNVGTNVACSGVIPFLNILLDDGTTRFNPGEFFHFYLSLLPPEATMDGGKGGFLFQRPKILCRKFNLHDPMMTTVYEANSIGEREKRICFVLFNLSILKCLVNLKILI